MRDLASRAARGPPAAMLGRATGASGSLVKRSTLPATNKWGGPAHGRKMARGSGAGGARPGARGARAKPFSVVVPFRDTPREREFAKASLPSAAALGPAEIVIGVDAPPAADLGDFLRGAAAAGGRRGSPPCRIVAVHASGKWAMHPAHVVHECFGRCSTETALLYNIDTTLRPAVLGGLDDVGRDGVAVVSYALRLLTGRRAGPTVRYWAYRARALVRGAGNSGTFWVHLPYYFGRVDASRYATIANGFDTYIYEALGAADGLRAVSRASVGVDCMDRENGDLEWRQFGYGVWQYANRHTAGGSGLAAAAARLLGEGAGRRAARLLAAANIAKHAAANGHPYSLKGWRWARRNPGSEAVRVAASVSYLDWTLKHESAQVGGLMDWPERGTGFAGGGAPPAPRPPA